MSTTTLGQLVINLRHECGHSPSPAAGINIREQFVYVLNRAEEELSLEYDFPGLQADRDIPLVIGSRYYAYPVDMPFDNVNRIWLLWNTTFCGLDYGIGPDEFALFDSNVGFTSWPVQRWQHQSDSNTIELWPVPSEAPVATNASQAALIRLRGERTIRPMVDDGDVCTLPATLIVLFAAVEILSREKDAGAPLKLEKAKEYLRRYKVRQTSHKQNMFVLGGGGNSGPGRVGLDYIPMGYGSGPRRG